LISENNFLSLEMRTILIIEDNIDIRENLEEILGIYDFKVISAENGEVGVNAYFEHLPNLVISDIAMPVKNGYEVLDKLSTHLNETKTPFIFLTASAQEKEIAKGKASKADAYLVKPYQVDELIEVINNLLDKR